MSKSVFDVEGDGIVNVGKRCNIDETAKIVFLKPAKVTFGDYCTVGAGVKIVVDGGDIFIGDWTTLHDNCLVLSSSGVSVDEHGWFGQNTIIDGTGGLRVGRGVRVGMYSQLWSHVAAGEQIEGCTLYGMRPLIIEDDVWLVGTCICSSGITIGTGTIALIGSNITKSCSPKSVLAGSPAAKKEGLSFYVEKTLSEKFSMLLTWLGDAAQKYGMELMYDQQLSLIKMRDDQNNEIWFFKNLAQFSSHQNLQVEYTVCCVENKSYVKKLTNIEQLILKYLSGNKARFYSLRIN